MDKLTKGMILGVVAFLIIYGLSLLKVSQTVIGGIIVVILIVSTIISRRRTRGN